jgi:hypothetical protein
MRLPKLNLDVINKAEVTIIDTVAAVSPWLAPVIPAYLTYTHMVGSLAYPTWVAFIGALVVECLGLAAIYTATQFWDYNDAKATERENRLVGMDKKERGLARKKRQRNAPFAWAAGAMAFYIIVILTVNAFLEMEASQSGFTVRVFSNALLSLLSVIAGLIIALRSQHRRRLMRITRRKDTQTITQAGTGDTQTAQVARKPISKADFLRLVSAQAYEDVADIATMHGLNGNYGDWLLSRRSVAELAKMANVKPRTAQYWTAKPKAKAERSQS